ncbi:MAG: hypothetical protein ILO34_07585 [Kiritimatiellae bacterium]|nr:hypothetical protein [Kiritimatiellia bacterium]
MKLLLLAGEESGLIYARRIRAELPDAEIRGYSDYGFETADLAVMGVWAVLKRIFYFLGVARTMKRAIDEWKPDVVCTIDYPGMNLKLSAYAKSKGVKTVHVVCPQVWAWRAGRIPGIERSTGRLCCFFPFEPQLFSPGFAEFVGHPLAEEFSGESAVEKGLLALLPGSRLGEIERILPTMLETLKLSGAKRAEIPAANDGAYRAIQKIVNGAEGVTVTRGGARELLLRADAALVASGTATLEAALAKCPTVLVYKVSAIFAFIMRRLIKGVRHIGIANIIWEKSSAAGEAPMPELLQEDFTAGAAAEILSKWLRDPAARESAAGRLGETVASLKSESAAKKIVEAILC